MERMNRRRNRTLRKDMERMNRRRNKTLRKEGDGEDEQKEKEMDGGYDRKSRWTKTKGH